MILGICGKSGSGKSTIAKIFAELNENVIHVDIDKIGHYIMSYPEVEEEAMKCFGEKIITDGIIDRKKLGELVFYSRNEMQKLTDITWIHMRKIIDVIIKHSKQS